MGGEVVDPKTGAAVCRELPKAKAPGLVSVGWTDVVGLKLNPPAAGFVDPPKENADVVLVTLETDDVAGVLSRAGLGGCCGVGS